MMDLKQRLLNLSPEKRKLLELKLKRQNLHLPKRSLLEVNKNQGERYRELAEEKKYYPLSSSQQRFYILNLFMEYTLPIAFQVEGEPDRTRFEVVLKALIERHESLRTSFVLVGEEPFQRIYKYEEVEFKVEYYDCSGRPGNSHSGVEAALKHVLRPFNISIPPLLRVGLIKLADSQHLFAANIHHLVSDGVSQGILFKEFIRLYRGEELPSLAIRYRDFSEWENRRFKPGEYKKQEKYWCDLFSGDIPLLNMPTDYPRPKIQSYEGIRLHFEIKGEILECLRGLASKEGVSPYMVLMAVSNILLYQYSGQEDIVLGTMTAGREQLELQGLIGVLVNPLATRNYPAPDKTFTGFLKELKHNAFKAFENQLYPFGDLVEKVLKKKDLSRNPLFDVMFIFLNRGIEREEVAGLEFTRWQLGQEYIAHAQQDITFYAIEEEENIRLDLEYCTALFRQETMERFFRHFINLLKGVAANPALKLPEIEMMSQEEKFRLLTEFNDTRVDYSREKTIQQLFAEQVKQTPDHVAVVGKDEGWKGRRLEGKNKEASFGQILNPFGAGHFSYKELNEKSQQLAHLLKETGVKPDTIVGIMVERSTQMIVGLLGILKACAAYMPIDPDYPRERILFMLEDSRVPILLTDSCVMKKHPLKTREYSREIIFLDDTREINQPDGAWNKEKDTIPEPAANLTDLAYIIYTSGSTGKPKGTAVEQKNLLAYLNSFQKEFAVTAKDTILQQASYGFDTFAEEVYPTLLKGAKLVIPDKNDVKDITALSEYILAHDVTIIDCSPLMLNELNQVLQKNSIHTYISGGDILKKEHIDNLLAKGTVYNTYGPTEITVCASYYRCPGGSDSSVSIPIGKPISNYRIYILDHHDRLLPIGIPGEICISGDGVSRGYLNNPELTAQKFCIRRPRALFINILKKLAKKTSCWDHSFQYPHTPTTHSAIYLTGDLARWRSDGNIEFLGRIDHQVKIRGFRIELGEIENRLLRHEDIKEAVVLDKEIVPGEKYLCAYITPIVPDNGKSSNTLVVSTLRKYLSGVLPDYMIPSQFVKLDKMPYTSHGKISHKLLREIDEDINVQMGTEYAAPRNEIEKKLAEMWSDTLRLEKVGINDNFFELGGHSLVAMRLISLLNEVFNVKLPLVDFFRGGTVKRIAKKIRDLQSKGDEVKEIKRKGLVHPFDLSRTPLLRVVVVKLQPERHLVFIDMHHIITDGMSIEIIFNEFTRLYADEELPGLSIQYKDFCQWQESFLAGESYQKQEEYWLNCYKGEIPRLNLPLDFPRPEVRRGEGKLVQANIGTGLVRQIKAFNAQHEVTLFMLLLAACNILLSKYSGQEDIIVGTPVSGRTHANSDQLVGLFVNTVAIRNFPGKECSFSQFLEEVKNNCLLALENQDYQFDMLIDKLNLSGNVNRNPLFDIMFTLDNVNIKNLDTGKSGLKVIPQEPGNYRALVDLTLSAIVLPDSDDIKLSFIYDIHLFKEETIQNMLAHFKNILSGIIRWPGKTLGALNIDICGIEENHGWDSEPGLQKSKILKDNDNWEKEILDSAAGELSLVERQRLLYELNDTQMEYPVKSTVNQLFEEQVQKTPHRIALVSEKEQLTYQKLDERANQIAQVLLEIGIEDNRCVGLMLERSPFMMAGILGILKAGGFYLPLGVNDPGERTGYVIADAGIKILLTHNYLQLSSLSQCVDYVIELDQLTFHELDKKNKKRPVNVTPGHLGYVIYTSGSTGKPKGVMVEHGALVNRLVWMQNMYPHGEGDTSLQKTTIVFDVSVVELFSWFMNGARVCLLASGAERDIREIIEIIQKHKITSTSFTPTMLQIFLNSLHEDNVSKLSSLKWIFAAGEQLPLEALERFKRLGITARLENLYGPTEAVVYASYYPCNPQSSVERVPIGKPLGNTRLYILDQKKKPLSMGKAGELCIAGISLARGYLNRPELTHERFCADSFFPGEKMYQTGDFARYLPGGNILFLGRIDSQVKIKGIRIEFGEIESALLKHPDIREASVIDRDDPQGIKYLAAYIISDKDFTVNELRKYLLQKLPDNMVPSVFIKVEQMPLTPSGKLDRRALAEMGCRIKISNEYHEPHNSIERKLALIWAGALKSNPIGINDNFFDLGGDSLIANLVLARINREFNTQIPVKKMFDAPNIKAFAEVISDSDEIVYIPIKPVEKKKYYQTSSPQKRQFILNRLNKEETNYHISGAIILEGILDEGRFKNTFKKIIQRHEVLRTHFEMVNGEIVQGIEDTTGFGVEFFTGEGWDERDIKKIIKGEIQLGPPPGEAGDKYVSPEPVEEKEYYQLSSAQKRMYILQQLELENIAYNIPTTFKFEGALDNDRLEETLRKLIQRHESLRTSFEIIAGEPVQRIHDKVEFELEVVPPPTYKDISHKKTQKDTKKEDPESQELRARSYIKTFIRPFNLSRAPLLRLGLVQLDRQKHLLVVDMHHIISDGISADVLVQDFTALYPGKELPEMKLQYKDYAEWQNREKQSKYFLEQSEYWRKVFAGEIPLLNVPTDFVRPVTQTFEGGEVIFMLEKEDSEALNQLALEEAATLYMILLTIFYIWLSKITGQEDIIIGTPVAGRRHADLEQIIGVFVNTLALRNYPLGKKIFVEFLREVKERSIEAFENQDYPFEDLVDRVAVNRDPGRNPLFDVMFSMQNIRGIDVTAPAPGTSKFDMTLVGYEKPENLYFKIEYSSKLFKEETLKRFIRFFKRIISSIAADPGKKIADIEIITEQERRQILDEFNDTYANYPRGKTLHQLFEEQVEQTPEHVALIGKCQWSTEKEPFGQISTVFGEMHLSYRELNEKSNQLAQLLGEKDVKPESIVGILVERSVEMIIGLLGILKAGGAYLPIDPDYPGERIVYMLRDSRAKVLVTTNNLAEEGRNVGWQEGETTFLDDIFKNKITGDTGNPEREFYPIRPLTHSPTQLGYIIYTSGTTGKPKGVMVEHRNVVIIVSWLGIQYRLQPGVHMLLMSDYTFDASVDQIFGSLINGASLYIVEKNLLVDIEALRSYIKTKGINIINFTPLFLEELLGYEEKLENLNTVISGGDRLENTTKDKIISKGYHLYNHYGPTETTIDALSSRCSKNSVNLGKPISNVKVYILDENQNVLPIGLTGELYISGPGVARGYLNKPGLTAEKFVRPIICHSSFIISSTDRLSKATNDKGQMTNDRLYRTGDIVRWLADGNIEFLGRIDHQVKIRGFRIELSEIENQLLSHKKIKEAVAMLRENKSGYKHLCAYIVPISNDLNSSQISNPLEISELREHLTKCLPHYMVPAYFVTLKNLPLTPNGKVDRKSLPEPELKECEEYAAPGNKVEEALTVLWEELLEIDRISTNDNFWEMGGDSIKAVQCAARLRKYGVKVEITDFFLNPTIEQLAKCAKKIDRDIDQGVVEGKVELTPIQEWFFQNHSIDHHYFNQSLMIYKKDKFDEEIAKQVFIKIVEHHDALRMVFYIKENNVIQRNRGIEESLFNLEVLNLEDESDVDKKIERAANRIQSGIDLKTGPLVRIGLFKTKNGDHLLIVIHHLVIDGVSWRILLEDFAIGYQQAERGEDIIFQNKTDSFKYWTHKLNKYALGEDILKELEYWQAQEEIEIERLPKDHEITWEKKKFGNSETVTLDLSEEETERLLKEVNQVYSTNINDILLVALGMSVRDTFRIEKVMISLEGHGREGIIEGVDISRTVGWFTSLFPVIFDMSKAQDISSRLKLVKETMRRIPNKGIGYGILRYLVPGDKTERMRFDLEPEISFNYLGQFGKKDKNHIFEISGMKKGNPISPNLIRKYILDINGIAAGEKLILSFTYNKYEYQRSTIEKLAHCCHANIKKIIEHCSKKQEREITPSDLGYSELSIEELEELEHTINQEIY